MSNKVTPATLNTQKEIIKALNSQSILLQLSYAQNKTISKIKQELMQQLFYVSQETALKAKFNFHTNSGNTLLADGKWNHSKPQQHGDEDGMDSFDDEEDEIVEDDNIMEEEEEAPEDHHAQDEEDYEQEQGSESSP